MCLEEQIKLDLIQASYLAVVIFVKELQLFQASAWYVRAYGTDHISVCTHPGKQKDLDGYISVKCQDGII